MSQKVSRVRLGNYLTAGFFMAAGIFMIAVILIKNYTFTTKYGLGAGFVPFVIAVCIMILSIVICVNTARGSYDEDEDKLPDRAGAKRVLYLLLFCALATLALHWLGMAVTIFLLYLFIVRFICEKSWISSLKAALIAAVVFYLLFAIGFSVKFPKGIFGF